MKRAGSSYSPMPAEWLQRWDVVNQYLGERANVSPTQQVRGRAAERRGQIRSDGGGKSMAPSMCLRCNIVDSRVMPSNGTVAKDSWRETYDYEDWVEC